MKKNDRIEVTVEGYSGEGYGVAKPDGYVLFIPGTLKGERVLAHVLKVGKSYGYAKAEKIIVPSENRVEPLCASGGLCGGCGLWHMKYEHELEFKLEKVKSNLKKAGIDITPERVIASDAVTGYRNKAQYPVRETDGRISVGFYRRASHSVVEERCLIQPEIFNSIAEAVKELMEKNGVSAYNEKTLSGTVRHIYLRASHDKSQIMLCLVVNGVFKEKELFANEMCRRFPCISTVTVNYNSDNTNVILGKRFETVRGSGYITDTLCQKQFEISAQSFYQINHDVCERLYDTAAEFAAADKDSHVLDLYCGIGTVGLCAASGAGHLTGIELVPQAVEDARKNAKLNGMSNTEFFACDAAEAEKHVKGGFDIIFVDPPRKGCDGKTLDFIKKLSPKRLVYISCDSATLARDAAILTDNGYHLARAAIADMFPRTKHVETVALFMKRAEN